jgi:hypothetical protein
MILRTKYMVVPIWVLPEELELGISSGTAET